MAAAVRDINLSPALPDADPGNRALRRPDRRDSQFRRWLQSQLQSTKKLAAFLLFPFVESCVPLGERFSQISQQAMGEDPRGISAAAFRRCRRLASVPARDAAACEGHRR
jgi:hypothetical protein